jgi:hypothetical protein
MTNADQQKNYRRREAAAYVREKHNLPCAAATLASLATRGGGPSYRLFGRVPIYSEEDLDAWVEARMGEPVRSTSEARGASREPHRKTPTPSTAPAKRARSAKPKSSQLAPAADNVPAPGESAEKASVSHYRETDIEDFVDRLVEATASGEAATTAPKRHRASFTSAVELVDGTPSTRSQPPPRRPPPPTPDTTNTTSFAAMSGKDGPRAFGAARGGIKGAAS